MIDLIFFFFFSLQRDLVLKPLDIPTRECLKKKKYEGFSALFFWYMKIMSDDWIWKIKYNLNVEGFNFYNWVFLFFLYGNLGIFFCMILHFIKKGTGFMKNFIFYVSWPKESEKHFAILLKLGMVFYYKNAKCAKC